MRALLIIAFMLSSATASAQSTVTLEKGDRAPARGRWIEEESFTLWWNEYHRLKSEVLALDGRLADAQARRIQVAAMLSAAQTRIDSQDQTIKDLRQSNDNLKAVNKELYTGWDVIKYSAGTGVVAVVIFVLIRGMQ